MLMAKEKVCERCGALADLPCDVQVTVTVTRRGQPLRERNRRGAHIAGGAVAAVAVMVAAVIAALQLSRSDAGGRAGIAHSRVAVAAAIAAAYRYPSRGLIITIATANPSYARADVTHRSGCGRYCGYDSAIFHRVGGSWRIVLDTTSYSCPVAALPARVQAELAVCP
jgi:hypothetical protein